MGLDVTMNGTQFVGIVEGAGHRIEQGHSEAQAKGGPFFEDAMQATALHILHCDVVEATIFAHIVDGNDGGMAQIRSGRRLTGKAAHKLFIKAELDGENLEGHPALEQGVNCQVDTGHPATTDLGADLVAAQPPTDQARHG